MNMNIDWNNKPEWAIGAGYSAKYNDWLWFDHSHYMSLEGEARFPFNSSFSKDDMTDIQLACDNQPKQYDVDWNEKPDWAVGHAVFRPSDSYVWFSDTHYQYIGSGDKYSTLVPDFKFDYLTNVQYAPAKEWDGKGFPPVGAVCVLVEATEFLAAHSGKVAIKPKGEKVVVIGHATRSDNHAKCVTLQPIDDMECGYSTINPDFVESIRSDKEKWVDQVIRIYDEKDEGARENFARLYDALTSGELPTPKVTK